MAFKKIYKSKEARAKLKAGLDLGADVAKITLGPTGRNVIVDRGIATPLITNDGLKSIQGLVLKDRAENMGLDLLKNIVLKTSENAKGARTASAVLAQALLDKGIEYLDNETIEEPINVISLNKSLKQVTDIVISKLKEKAIPIKTIDDIRKVATISSESKEIGEIVASAFNEVGNEGIITTEEDATKVGIEVEITKGMKINKGWVDSYMVTDYAKMEAEYSNVGVILVEKKLMMISDIQKILEVLGTNGVGEILLIAEDIEGEVLQTCITNKLKGGFKIVGVRTPGNFTQKREILNDIAILTGATVLTDDLIKEIQNLAIVSESKDSEIKDHVFLKYVGFSSKIIVGKESSVILGNPEKKKEVEERINALRDQKKTLKSKIEVEGIEDRIAKLNGGAAIIKVGTATSIGINYTKDKIDDAVAESKASYEEGVVAGGGSTLAKLSYDTSYVSTVKEEIIAYEIIKEALKAPLLQIMKNSGTKNPEFDLKVMIDESLSHPNNGFNALNNSIVDDMVEDGIIDAVKVLRIALENASEGIASILTTEVLEAEEIINNNKE